MNTQTLRPICFSTSSLEEALQELAAFPIENLSIVEDQATDQHLIFGEMEEGVSLPPFQFCSYQEIPTDIWTQQWAEFAPHFKEGFAHIDLQDYEGPGINFRMAPGGGFGDLSHATTEMCLRALCKAPSRSKTIIDIGTGSGVLALAAFQLGFKTILALEIDETALAHAKSNFSLNQADSILLQTELGAIPDNSLIMLNMTWGEQEILFETTPHLLKSSAEWIVSGLLIEQVEDYLKAYFPGRTYTLLVKDEWACVHVFS